MLTILAAALVLGLATGPLKADPITQIVVFGDSLSDTGNSFNKIGMPPSPYYNGRWSNGPVWVERLATNLGVPVPTPSEQGGTNYAYGYATTGTGLSPQGTPNVGMQVNTYLGKNTPNAQQLFVLWAGANDVFNGQTNPVTSVGNLAGYISTLATAGAKQFLVPNYPDLSQTPYGNANSGQQPGLKLWTQGYNQVLAFELGQLQAALGPMGVHITTLDNYDTFQKIVGNPGAYGFSNVTTSATGDMNLGAQGYLFWDSVHPTTAGHQVIGDNAYAAVTPEPSSLSLLAMGTLGLAGVAWRRRRVAQMIC
jgi:phospholipase/lecithinase/hemolysin